MTGLTWLDQQCSPCPGSPYSSCSYSCCCWDSWPSIPPQLPPHRKPILFPSPGIGNHCPCHYAQKNWITALCDQVMTWIVKNLVGWLLILLLMYYSELQDGAAGGPGGRGVLCFCAGRDAAPGLAGEGSLCSYHHRGQPGPRSRRGKKAKIVT